MTGCAVRSLKDAGARTTLSVRNLQPPVFIQGGSHKVFSPTKEETHAFRRAVAFQKECMAEGIQSTLGCLVNDIGLPKDQRPKTNGGYTFPEEYVAILRETGLAVQEVQVFYESTLRNRARKDRIVTLTVNEAQGIPVARCPSIMGRFYKTLEGQGFVQKIGFYTLYDCGPDKGKDPNQSGYSLTIRVDNYYVDAEGRVFADHL